MLSRLSCPLVLFALQHVYGSPVRGISNPGVNAVPSADDAFRILRVGGPYSGWSTPAQRWNATTAVVEGGVINDFKGDGTYYNDQGYGS